MKSLSAKRERIPYLQLNVRRNTFLEASAGYSEEEARSQAERCVACHGSPCAAACPVGTAVPRFLAAVAEGDFTEAYDAIAEDNPLAPICSRVCADNPRCEGGVRKGSRRWGRRDFGAGALSSAILPAAKGKASLRKVKEKSLAGRPSSVRGCRGCPARERGKKGL
jgi:hypothetical protein